MSSTSTIKISEGLYVLYVLAEKKVASLYFQSDAAATIKRVVDGVEDMFYYRQSGSAAQKHKFMSVVDNADTVHNFVRLPLLYKRWLSRVALKLVRSICYIVRQTALSKTSDNIITNTLTSLFFQI